MNFVYFTIYALLSLFKLGRGIRGSNLYFTGWKLPFYARILSDFQENLGATD